MNINTLTIKAQEALQAALTLARERGQQAVEPLHILAALLREGGFARRVPLGAHGRRRADAAQRRGAGRRVAAPRRGGRRAVFRPRCLAHGAARRRLHEEIQRPLRVGRTPAAGARGRARAGFRSAQTVRDDRARARRGDPHLPQGVDGRFADRPRRSSMRWANMP